MSYGAPLGAFSPVTAEKPPYTKNATKNKINKTKMIVSKSLPTDVSITMFIRSPLQEVCRRLNFAEELEDRSVWDALTRQLRHRWPLRGCPRGRGKGPTVRHYEQIGLLPSAPHTPFHPTDLLRRRFASPSVHPACAPRRSSLPGRTRLPYGLFGETSHVVKSRRQRSIIERARRPFSFDNKASIAEDLDPPALPRRPRFGSKEGAVRHEFVGAAHSSLLAFSSSQWPSQTAAPAKSGHSPTAANGSIDRRSNPLTSLSTCAPPAAPGRSEWTSISQPPPRSNLAA